MSFSRLSRLRKNSATRDWVSETELRSKDLILPYFVVEGKDVKRPIRSMPGLGHLSIDNVLKDIDQAIKLGIRSILLFGIPRSKDEKGFSAYKKHGIVQRAAKAIKKKFKDLIIITDVCLCGYTSHGHCGIISKDPEPQGFGASQRRKGKGRKNYIIDNDATLKVLSKIALSHAEAGADLVAPSAMMDGQVWAIRQGLDRNGFRHTGILAYSAKYASNFYGPFRDALGSSPQFGDRKSYQMDFRNSDKALREIREDIDEGADIVMVKPALSYLDVIYRVKKDFSIPVAAYNVSGEYSMVKAYLESKEQRAKSKEAERNIVLEMLTSIKRAGADFIITYWAKDVARWLKNS